MQTLNKIGSKLLEVFEENNGRLSSTRVYSLLVLIYWMYFDTHYINKGNLVEWNFILLNVVFLIAVFVPKYLQKLAELKFSK